MTRSRDISFRTVAHDDIRAVQDLAGRIWREHYPGIITREQIDYMLGKMYAAEVIADEIANKGYRYDLVLRDREAVGYLSSRFDDDSRTVLVSKLYLLPALHGQGIGRRMLQRVKDDAVRAGAQSISLFVNKGNSKAIRAYERYGFVKDRETVTDIGSGYVMDDFGMELRL